MTSLCWFRRFRTEISTHRVPTHYTKSAKFVPIAPSWPMLNRSSASRTMNDDIANMFSKNTDNTPLLRCRMLDMHLYRFHHVSATLSDPVKPPGAIDYARVMGSSCLYPSGMDERFRTTMKYLTFKTQLEETSRGPTTPAKTTTYPKPKSKSGGMAISESSYGSRSIDGTPRSISSTLSHSNLSTASSTVSISVTRNETARAIVNTAIPEVENWTQTDRKLASRAKCPKPIYTSPYSRSSEDEEPEGTSLRSHYMKVLKKPDRKLGVLFPRSPKQMSVEPRFKPRKFDQFYLSNQTSNKTQINTDPGQRQVNNYHHIRMKTQDGNLNKKTKKLQKRVDVVQMEVIKLCKSHQHSQNVTGINQQLKEVLREALEQNKQQQFVMPVESVKSESKNISRTNLTNSSSPIVPSLPDNVKTMATSTNATADALSIPSQVDSTLSISESTDDDSKCDANIIINHNSTGDCLYTKTDGKHGYNILECKPERIKEIRILEGEQDDNECFKLKAIKDLDVSFPLTDLNGYECGVDASSNSKERNASNPPDKQEIDFKIARYQHNQRLINVFEDVNRIKVN